MRECTQYVARFEVAPADQRQSFKTDHRVAAPVGEPVVARNHGSYFVTGCVRPGGIANPRLWSNDELIRGENEFPRPTFPRFRPGGLNEFASALVFPVNGL